MSAKVLILEDEAPLNDLYARVLRRAGFTVEQAYSLAEARAHLDRERYDFFIVDIRLPDGVATELLRAYQAQLQEQGTEVIVLTAEARYRLELAEMGYEHYFEKPISLQMLSTFLQRLWQARQQGRSA
ncbi:MAG: response regulator [Chloroflexi bacterium]|nr:response regulator [Chloroflexota bacterium]